MKRLFIVPFFIMANIAHTQTLSKLADSLRQSNHFPEMGYAVISIDSILELGIVGYHKIDDHSMEDTARITDYFHLGSNTKAITGFIVASLVETNKIEWTTKFFDLFPDWKEGSNAAYYKITLQDLLSHRAGIEPYTSGLEFQELPEFKGSNSSVRKQFARYLLREKAVPNTGEAYTYSNAGYTIASVMIEKATGKTWEQLVAETFMRLKLNYKLGWPNKWNIHQPWGHLMENDTLKAQGPNIDYNLKLIEPAGDISMQLPDYARFIQLNLQGLTGKDNYLKATSYQFIHYGQKDYSIGWGNINTSEKQQSSHAGSAGTFFCYTIIDRLSKMAFIVVANSATENTQKAVFKMVQIMKSKYQNK